MFRNLKLAYYRSTICCYYCHITHLISNYAQFLSKFEQSGGKRNLSGCSQNEKYCRLLKHKELENLEEEELLHRLSNIQKFGVTMIKEIDYLKLIKLHPHTLKNRVMSMQEYGFLSTNINSATLRSFLTLSLWEIKVLKKLDLIEKNTNIYNSLLDHARLKKCIPPADENEFNIVSLKKEVLCHLLKNEIGMTDETLKEKTEILRRLKHKSIRLIRKSIHIAKNILGIPPEKICRHPYILWTDPDNVLKVIEEIKELGGVDIKLCMSMYPKILVSSYENTRQIKQCLEEYNFSQEAIQKGIFIFTLASKNVKNRLRELEKEPIFSVCRKNSKVLGLVYYYNKIKLRLRLLEEGNIYTSLSAISSDEETFNKVYKHGFERYTGGDTIQYLCSEFGCSATEFRKMVRGCNFWRVVPVLQVAKNLNYLRQIGFSNGEILKCIQILFYNRGKIVEELNSLDMKDGLECCKENGNIRREYLLPLVVYFIEKTCNFSSNSFCAGEEDEIHKDILIPHANVC